MAKQYRGLYVDGFDKILGNPILEQQLLDYCKKNSFNALCTYKTKDIHKQINITNPNKGGKILASFIKRAKQNYGIESFAMSSERYETFKNIVAEYNRSRIDTIERVNVFNFEFEFWNRHSTAPGGYYCKQYLEAANCDCDSSGAFVYYRKELRRIDSLAHATGVKSEIYVGKPNAGQAKVIANSVDRILVDIYLKKPEKAYERAADRMSYFSSATKTCCIIPIWGSTDEFLGEWQITHKLEEAEKIFMDEFALHSKEYPLVVIPGFQWYKYSTMKK